ncbi:MAG: transposase [Elusimicrobiota bacterium]|nr:transposase [Elusimicrobiota bacterium]
MKTKFRKNIRLKNYDYSTNGYYFETMVTRDRLPIFKGCRSDVEKCVNELPLFIKGLLIDYLAVMDNHIHVIFVTEDCDKVLGQIVRTMKYKITKTVAGELLFAENKSHGNATATNNGIWQPNYYDHVIRNEESLSKRREYIENNPLAEKIDWNKLDT